MIIKQNEFLFLLFSQSFWDIYNEDLATNFLQEKFVGDLQRTNFGYITASFYWLSNQFFSPYLFKQCLMDFNKTLTLNFFCFLLWNILASQIYKLRNLIRNIFWRIEFIIRHHKSHSNLHMRNFRYVSYFLPSHSFIVYVGFHFIRTCFIVVTNRIL